MIAELEVRNEPFTFLVQQSSSARGSTMQCCTGAPRNCTTFALALLHFVAGLLRFASMRSQMELSQWRSKLAASSREWTARNHGLRAEIHALRRHCSGLRTGGMTRFRADQAFALRQLCVER